MGKMLYCYLAPKSKFIFKLCCDSIYNLHFVPNSFIGKAQAKLTLWFRAISSSDAAFLCFVFKNKEGTKSGWLGSDDGWPSLKCTSQILVLEVGTHLVPSGLIRLMAWIHMSVWFLFDLMTWKNLNFLSVPVLLWHSTTQHPWPFLKVFNSVFFFFLTGSPESSLGSTCSSSVLLVGLYDNVISRVSIHSNNLGKLRLVLFSLISFHDHRSVKKIQKSSDQTNI